MITTSIELNGKQFSVDLSNPKDISQVIVPDGTQANCFYAPQCTKSPVRAGDFVGSAKEGGLLNFFNLTVNPHGNGTHTECVGHLSKKDYFVQDCFEKYHFIGKLISVTPYQKDEDFIVAAKDIKALVSKEDNLEAIVIRTLPNTENKLAKNYSGTNPCYFEPEGIEYLKQIGIKHLVVDTPSVDREEDEGKLLAHKVFWNYPEKPITDSTISELAFINNAIKDGLYLVQFSISNIRMDVSSSKILLYELINNL